METILDKKISNYINLAQQSDTQSLAELLIEKISSLHPNQKEKSWLYLYSSLLNQYTEHLSEVHLKSEKVDKFFTRLFLDFIQIPECDLKNLPDQSYLFNHWWNNPNKQRVSFIHNIPHLYRSSFIEQQEVNNILNQFLLAELIPVNATRFLNDKKNTYKYEKEKISWVQFALMENWTFLNMLENSNQNLEKAMNLTNTLNENVWHVYTHCLLKNPRPNYLEIFSFISQHSYCSVLQKDKNGDDVFDILAKFKHNNHHQFSAREKDFFDKMVTELEYEFNKKKIYENLNTQLPDNNLTNHRLKL